MTKPRYSAVLRIVTLSALPFLGACAAEHSTGMVLQPGGHARVTIMGEHPHVLIESREKHPVDMELRSPALPPEHLVLTVPFSRRMADRSQMDFTNRGPDVAQVFITVRGGTGLTLEQGR